jgi:hypothetical protein
MSRSIKKALAPIVSRLSEPDPFAYLIGDKKALIDFVFQRFRLKSFADLGGVWNVAGGYTFYALEKFAIEKAFLVDTDFTDDVLQRAKLYPALEAVHGNFGKREIIRKVRNVDAVFLFDTLLHQVDPDWDELLKAYSSTVKHFVILNQQYTGSEHTTRLLNLGEDEYFKNVPHNRDEPPYDSLFEKLDEVHPQHQRPYRDIHNIWQWGITDVDLLELMRSLGFTMQFYKNSGQFGTLKKIENHSFVFSR